MHNSIETASPFNLAHEISRNVPDYVLQTKGGSLAVYKNKVDQWLAQLRPEKRRGSVKAQYNKISEPTTYTCFLYLIY